MNGNYFPSIQFLEYHLLSTGYYTAEGTYSRYMYMYVCSVMLQEM